MLDKWKGLLQSPPKDRQEVKEIKRDIAKAKQPCNHAWLMARIGSLLHPYYAGNAPASSLQMMAEDWSHALSNFPMWAIDKSIRWWKSADNPERKRKPLEGDIEARCNHEMGVVRVAEISVQRFERGARPQKLEPDRPEPTAEQIAQRKAAAEKILAEAGFNLKA